MQLVIDIKGTKSPGAPYPVRAGICISSSIITQALGSVKIGPIRRWKLSKEELIPLSSVSWMSITVKRSPSRVITGRHGVCLLFLFFSFFFSFFGVRSVELATGPAGDNHHCRSDHLPREPPLGGSTPKPHSPCKSNIEIFPFYSIKNTVPTHPQIHVQCLFGLIHTRRCSIQACA